MKLCLLLSGAKLTSAEENEIIPTKLKKKLLEMVKNRNDIVHEKDTNRLPNRKTFMESFEMGIDHLHWKQNMSKELKETYQSILNNR